MATTVGNYRKTPGWVINGTGNPIQGNLETCMRVCSSELPNCSGFSHASKYGECILTQENIPTARRDTTNTFDMYIKI